MAPRRPAGPDPRSAHPPPTNPPTRATAQPTGLDFARWLRAEEGRNGWAQTPLIAVTGKPSISTLANLTGVVLKPYNTERLQECFETWCPG